MTKVFLTLLMISLSLTACVLEPGYRGRDGGWGDRGGDRGGEHGGGDRSWNGEHRGNRDR